MGKRNKIRYQSTPKARVAIVLTGRVWLLYRDEENIEKAAKGDLMLHPYNDALRTARRGDYGSMGFAGYFKVDVHDGREWRPVLTNDIFLHREHYFSKKECPIDTYELCASLLQSFSGRTLIRTYREHYELEEGILSSPESR